MSSQSGDLLNATDHVVLSVRNVISHAVVTAIWDMRHAWTPPATTNIYQQDTEALHGIGPISHDNIHEIKTWKCPIQTQYG